MRALVAVDSPHERYRSGDRARRGISGALYPQSALAGPNARLRVVAFGASTPRAVLTVRSRAMRVRESGQVRKEAALSGSRASAAEQPDSSQPRRARPETTLEDGPARSFLHSVAAPRPESCSGLERRSGSPGSSRPWRSTRPASRSFFVRQLPLPFDAGDLVLHRDEVVEKEGLHLAPALRTCSPSRSTLPVAPVGFRLLITILRLLAAGARAGRPSPAGESARQEDDGERCSSL